MNVNGSKNDILIGKRECDGECALNDHNECMSACVCNRKSFFLSPFYCAAICLNASN